MSEAYASAKAEFEAIQSIAMQEAQPEAAEVTPASEPTATTEAAPEAMKETNPEEPKDKTKNLYKALGKKDKRIEELESELARVREAQNSSNYEEDSVALVENVARRIVLERELARTGDESRDRYVKEHSPDAETFAAVEEIRNAHPTLPWEAAHKLYLSYSDRREEPPKRTTNAVV